MLSGGQDLRVGSLLVKRENGLVVPRRIKKPRALAERDLLGSFPELLQDTQRFHDFLALGRLCVKGHVTEQ